MQLIVRAKNRYGYLVAALLLFVGGLVMLFGIRGAEFLPTMGRVVGFVSSIAGVVYFSRFVRLSQPDDHTIAIADHTVRYDDAMYPFDTLTFSMEQLEDSYLVSLWAKRGEKQTQIFKKLPFDAKEREKFLHLIRPYLAHSDLTQRIAKQNDRIVLYDDGFAVDGKEFLYSELQGVKTTIVFKPSTETLQLDITRKDNDFDLYFFDDIPDMAKALIIEMRYNQTDLEIPCDKPITRKWLMALLVIAIAVFVADVAYFQSGVAFFIGIAFFGFGFYISALDRKLFYYKLCQELKRVLQTQESSKE